MDSTGFNLLPECPPLNKPPGFNGQYYTYWKQKMKDFLEATDIDLWDIIENGYNPPSAIENGITILKPRSSWSEDEKNRHLLASKAKWIISNSLGPNEYERVSNCSTAKEMWDALEIAHVGTTQVKASKVHTLVSEYELFKMKDGESIKDMVQRFTAIVNHLGILGRRFENADLIHKVLRSLTIDWQPKITAIKESLKMGMPSLQELFGNLEEHEMELKRFSKNDEDRRKRSLALKATVNHDEEEDELESLDDLEEDEELALLSKKYQKFLRLRKGGNKKKSSFPKKSSNKGDQQNTSIPTCFECKKPGHIKPDCPVYLRRLLENERKKRTKHPAKKAHLATWGDDDIDSGDEEEKEEEALLCLMAIDGENMEVNDSDLNSSDDENNDVDDLYSELYDDLIKAQKNVSLSKKVITTLESNVEELQKENDSLKKKIENLDISSKICQMCEILKAKVDDLTKSLEKFTNGKKNLDTLLGNQRIGLNKEGLGYEQITSKSFLKNFFVRKSMGNKPHITCYYCGQKGHGIDTCAHRKGTYVPSAGEKLIWMPKSSIIKSANPNGPKTIWVPAKKK